MTDLRATLGEEQFRAAVDKAIDLLNCIRVDGPDNSVAIAALLLATGAVVGMHSQGTDIMAALIWREICSDDGRQLYMTGYETLRDIRLERSPDEH